MNNDEPQSDILPNMVDFCLNVPLYKSFKIDENDEKELKKLSEIRNYDGYLDCYCIECGQPSVFHLEDIN